MEGITKFTRDDFEYEAANYGLLMQNSDQSFCVVSQINGSLCLNQLDADIDASQFDEYITEVIQGEAYVAIGLAKLNPATLQYERQ